MAQTAWYGIVDLDTVLFGHDASDGQRALPSLIVGLVYILLAIALDRRGAPTLALWLHVTGGLAAGGAILFYWHSGDGEWLLTLLVALVYLAVARVLGRSSYAVFAVVGILAASTHFIAKWTDIEPDAIFYQRWRGRRRGVGAAALHPRRARFDGPRAAPPPAGEPAARADGRPSC